jgi:hypothetical protein
LFGYLATDVDCGFKLFKRSILSKISLPSDGAMIDTQLYAGARARGLKVVETPVTHLPRTAGQSTGGNPKVILKALKELVIYWWQLKNEIMVEQGKAVFKYEAILLAIILLVAGFMRIYKIADYMTFLRDDGVAGMPEQEAAVALGYLGSTTKWPRSCVGKDGRTTPSLGHVGLNEEL